MRKMKKIRRQTSDELSRLYRGQPIAWKELLLTKLSKYLNKILRIKINKGYRKNQLYNCLRFVRELLQILDPLTGIRFLYCRDLTHWFPVHSFSTPLKRKNSFFDVLRGQRKGALGKNGLNFFSLINSS